MYITEYTENCLHLPINITSTKIQHQYEPPTYQFFESKNIRNQVCLQVCGQNRDKVISAYLLPPSDLAWPSSGPADRI